MLASAPVESVDRTGTAILAIKAAKTANFFGSPPS